MNLVVITPPAVEPVLLAEMKLHLREDLTDQDSLITAWIKAAREYCEGVMGRAFITQTLEMVCDGFGHCLELLRPPLISVTSVKYIGTDGIEQTVSASDYQVLTSGAKAAVVPAYGLYWPTARSQPESVRVRYQAGYGASGTSVPEHMKSAIKLLVAHWYENREASVVTGATVQQVPLAVESLLWLERVAAI